MYVHHLHHFSQPLLPPALQQGAGYELFGDLQLLAAWRWAAWKPALPFSCGASKAGPSLPAPLLTTITASCPAAKSCDRAQRPALPISSAVSRAGPSQPTCSAPHHHYCLLPCSKELDVSRLEACSTCTGSGIKSGTQPSTCSTCNGAGQVVSVTRTPLGAFQQVSEGKRQGLLPKQGQHTLFDGSARQSRQHTLQLHLSSSCTAVPPCHTHATCSI